MKILNAYIEGFKRAFSSRKIAAIIYGSTLFLAFMIILPFKNVMINNFGENPQVYKLLNDFNFTTYVDLINNYGDLINPFITVMFWMGAFYFFFTLFFAGGLIKFFEVSSIKSKAQTFFSGCAKYFFRFLRLGLYVLLIQLILFTVIFFIFNMIFEPMSKSSPEPQLFTFIVVWASIHLLFFLFISIVSDYAKIFLVKDDSKKVWRALWTAFKFSLKKIYLTYPLYILLLIFPLLLTIFYLWIESAVGMTNALTVLIMALIQQLIIFARLFAKVWILGSEYELFNNHLAEKTKPLLTQEFLLNESL